MEIEIREDEVIEVVVPLIRPVLFGPSGSTKVNSNEVGDASSVEPSAGFELASALSACTPDGYSARPATRAKRSTSRREQSELRGVVNERPMMVGPR